MITIKQAVYAEHVPDLIAYILASEIEHDAVPNGGYIRFETSAMVVARCHYLFGQEH